ncbi:hypothetical protein C1M51_02805 [Methylibium sp. Pch-M]|uniref:hypothetical protein n=1 Tax=Methylibium sp. Pch-M TaxID=2082386 RepID=UPI001012F60D|nr:hypothetical protein [Methylibium sp. Pch-M]QAZ38435.1 hypothetical protein C1M51_02805 [Methylibium sp. Pch-M]
MANRFWSGEFGATKVDVAETGTTTAGADVEVRITYDATNNGKQAALMTLDAIRQRIIEDTWPPA